MGLFNTRSALERLEEFLEKERTAILNGDFGMLATLAREKERLQLVQGSLEPQRNLVRLQKKVQRNQALLQAASRGIKDVSRRLSRNLQQENPLRTYDCDGRRQLHSGASGTVERRA